MRTYEQALEYARTHPGCTYAEAFWGPFEPIPEEDVRRWFAGDELGEYSTIIVKRGRLYGRKVA